MRKRRSVNLKIDRHKELEGERMSKQKLSEKKIAFLATDGFEQIELNEPSKQLKAAGVEVHLISPKFGKF